MNVMKRFSALFIIVFISIPFAASTVYAQPAAPANILAYVPITITNTQPVPTPSPFQQMIIVNSKLYSKYEAQNLQNVEFFYANGTLIPSWLESGNSTSTRTVYWVRIGGIGADSSITIYMGFAPISTVLQNDNLKDELLTLKVFNASGNNLGNMNPGAWAALTVYGSGGFLTVGGDGFDFYNGTFEAPSAQHYGFLLGAAWDGKEFLVVGSKYGPVNGALAYLYYPSNNSLKDISSLFPASMSTNSSLIAAAWNGSIFYILGSIRQNQINSTTQLFTYDPRTGSLKNVSDILPNSFKEMYNWPIVSMLSTPYGTAVFFIQEYQPVLGFIVKNGTLINISKDLPLGFKSGSTFSSQVSADMAYVNDALFLAGNINYQQPDVVKINLSTMQTTDYADYFSNTTGTLTAIACTEGYVVLGGGARANFNPNSPPVLYVLITGSQPRVFNISNFIPASFGAISTMSACNGTVFMASSRFGNVQYMEVTLPSTAPQLNSLNIVMPSVNVAQTPTVIRGELDFVIPFNNGINWSVTLDGVIKSSSSTSINFTELFGVHDYTVNVSGKNISGSVNLTQSRVITVNASTVEFILPYQIGKSSWSASIDGITRTTNLSTISFLLPTGSYSYNVSFAGRTVKGLVSLNTTGVSKVLINVPLQMIPSIYFVIAIIFFAALGSGLTALGYIIFKRS